jgi:pimeloyl-ACP methyl ester carboxylesterase
MTNPTFLEFPTADGLILPGLLYPARESDTVIISLHGNGSTSIFYNEYEQRAMTETLIKNGISLFAFNNRGAHLIKSLRVRKQEKDEHRYFGMSYEIIKECVDDIDGAVAFLQKQGYNKFILMGSSTGANKICVYNHYQSKNPFERYILLGGGDDTGIYYDLLGKEKFFRILKASKQKIADGQGEALITKLLPDALFSYQAFYDMCNPDGDYNCFPFYEAINNTKLSTKPLFRYFKEITKPTLVVYGKNDEYAWGDVPRVVELLKNQQPDFAYTIINNADHGFHGCEKELAKKIIQWV